MSTIDKCCRGKQNRRKRSFGMVKENNERVTVWTKTWIGQWAAQAMTLRQKSAFWLQDQAPDLKKRLMCLEWVEQKRRLGRDKASEVIEVHSKNVLLVALKGLVFYCCIKKLCQYLLTQLICVILEILWVRIPGCSGSLKKWQSDVCRGYSHLRACLRLDDPFPRWLTHKPGGIAGCCQEAPVPHHMDLSIGMPECPHNKAVVRETERER